VWIWLKFTKWWMVLLVYSLIVSSNTTPTGEHVGTPRSYAKRGSTPIWGNISSQIIWNAPGYRTVTSATLNSFKNGLKNLRKSKQMGLLWSSVAKDPWGRASPPPLRRWVIGEFIPHSAIYYNTRWDRLFAT